MNLRLPLTATLALGLAACVDQAPPEAPAKTVTLSIENLQAPEGTASKTPFEIKATLSEPAESNLVIPLSVIGGTATQGVDYEMSEPKSLVFQKGATQATYRMSVLFDRLSEQNETVLIGASTVNGGPQNIAASTGTVTIIDDESVQVTITGTTTTEGDGDNTLQLRATLSTAAIEAVSIPVTVKSGSATEGTDYRIPHKTIDFDPGSTTSTLSVVILDDSAFESPENIVLSSTAMDAGTQHFEPFDITEVTINDSDSRGPLGLTLKSATVAENGRIASIEATLSEKTEQDLTLSISVEPGASAAQDKDFILPNPSTLTIPAGQRKATFNITIIDDNLYEGPEELTLKFAANTGEQAAADVTIADNDPLPKASFSFPSQTASEETSVVAATISLDSLSETSVQVQLATSGTIAVGTDVELPSGLKVTIPAGTQSVQYPITVKKDTVKEGGEVLTLTITSALPVEVSPTNKTFDLVLIGDYTINDTGVTTYTDGTNGNLSANPTAARKQDADFGRDARLSPNGFRLTKLDIDGNPIAVDSPVWYCVRDEVTGLVWEVKAPAKSSGADNGYTFRSASYRYTWYNTDASTSGGYAGAQDKNEDLEDEDDPHSSFCGYPPEKPARSPASYCNTQDFVKEATRYAFCGRSDWKLPSANQLQSLVNYGDGMDALTSDYFPTPTNTESLFSANTAAGYPAAALCLNTLTRRIEQCQKNVHYNVMLVSELPK